MSPRLHAVPEAGQRAVGYVRVSQERTEMISPVLQRAAIEDHCARHGYQLLDVVEDLDMSGRSWAKRRVESLVGRIEAGDADVLVVWKWSRVARNRRDWAVANDRVDVAGGRIESATEDVDVSTSTGRLTRGMLAELAAWESERIGEQWKETHAHRRARGLPHRHYERIGYTRVRTAGGDGYQIDPVTAPLVAELYGRYVAGEGLRQLARWLEDQGVTSPATGRRWTTRGIGYLLENGWSAGLLYSAKAGTWQPGAHPPIIDRALFDAYQAEHARRQQTAPRLLAPATMLSGLVYCGHCGKRCRLRTDRRYGPAYMFTCGIPCDVGPSITRRAAEAAVLGWLEAHASDRVVRDGTSAADKAARVAWKAEQHTLRRRQLDLDTQLATLTREMVAGRVPAGTYETVRDELQEALREADGRSRELSVRLGRPRPSAAQFQRVLSVWDGLDVKGRQAALRDVLARVDVVRTARVRGGAGEARPVGVWEVVDV